MKTEDLIAAGEFCAHYHIEYTFISSLNEAGLLTVTTVDDSPFIPTEELKRLESMVHLHHDLYINVAGIEAITHLLERVEAMQQEMIRLNNRLRRYNEITEL